jgi:hypothetical protein
MKGGIKMQNIVLIIIFFLSVSGCNIFRPPVIQDRISKEIWPWSDAKIGTFAISPDYSMSYIRLNKETKFCAQAPADSASQISTAISALAKVEIPEGATVTPEVQVATANAIKQLFRRSQGIQLYRDGQFGLCNAYLNGAIDENQYYSEIIELRKIAAELAKEEVKGWKEYSYDTSANPHVSVSKPKDTSVDALNTAAGAVAPVK